MSGGQHMIIGSNTMADEEEEDEDCMVVEAHPRRAPEPSLLLLPTSLGASAGVTTTPSQLVTPSAGSEEDEDCLIVSTKGSMPSDLPHARAHCTLKKFVPVEHKLATNPPNAEHCPNCYCFLCETKADEAKKQSFFLSRLSLYRCF